MNTAAYSFGRFVDCLGGQHFRSLAHPTQTWSGESILNPVSTAFHCSDQRSRRDTNRLKRKISGHFKHFCKALYDSFLNLAHVNFMAEQVFHGSYLFAVAGDDQVEETQIGIHVERKAVCRYPTRYVNADGGNFSARS